MAAATKTYEAMFLLPAGASAELEKSTALVRGIIEKHEGKIMVIKKWDERKLAYEMGAQKRGLFIIAYFTAPGKAITAIEREVNLSEEVVRVLVTHADHLNESEMNAVEPQPIQPREERAPWDRPYGEDGGYGGGGGGGGGGRRPFRRDDKPEGAAPAPAARE